MCRRAYRRTSANEPEQSTLLFLVPGPGDEFAGDTGQGVDVAGVPVDSPVQGEAPCFVHGVVAVEAFAGIEVTETAFKVMARRGNTITSKVGKTM